MESHKLLLDLLKNNGLKVSSWAWKDEHVISIQRQNQIMGAYAQLIVSNCENKPVFMFACHQSWITYNFHTVDFDQLICDVQRELDNYQKILDEEFGGL